MPDPDVDMPREEAIEEFLGALLDDDAEALYERAPCGYLSTTPDGLIVKVNRTFLAWTGYRREDLVGRRRFADLLTGGGRIYHETHYAPMLRMQGQAREIALDVVTADGSRLPVLLNAVMEVDAAGEPAVVRAAVFDASHRREYERELLLAKRRAEESEARAVALARTLQATLLPSDLPDITGLDVAAAYRSAAAGADVGGDFYDVFQIGPHEWVAVLGDVEGKGVDAAVVTALVRDALRAAAVRCTTLGEMLDTTNQVLLRRAGDRFCTALLLRLRDDDGTWRVTVACAGHAAPLLRRGGDAPREVGRRGALLGVYDEPTFREEELALEPGDALLLFTDGVTEAHDEARDAWYGEERLAAALAAAPPSAAALVDHVLADVLAFESDHLSDDIALLALVVPPRG